MREILKYNVNTVLVNNLEYSISILFILYYPAYSRTASVAGKAFWNSFGLSELTREVITEFVHSEIG